MTAARINWSWRDRAVTLGIEKLGKGPVVLLLPALSSISTRQDAFLAAARKLNDPILVVYGAETPARAEMETLYHLPNVQSRELPAGKLAVHEEFPALVADAVRPCLRQASGRSGQF